MDTEFKVINDKGRVFNVRVVGPECVDPYTEDEWRVEFYDATYAGAKFGPLGQFVTRYFRDTLLFGPSEHGLCLDGGNAGVWYLDPVAMTHCKRMLA